LIDFIPSNGERAGALLSVGFININMGVQKKEAHYCKVQALKLSLNQSHSVNGEMAEAVLSLVLSTINKGVQN